MELVMVICLTGQWRCKCDVVGLQYHRSPAEKIRPLIELCVSLTHSW